MDEQLKAKMDRMEILIGKILRFGVAVAVFFMVVGILLIFIHPNIQLGDYTPYVRLAKLWQGLIAFNPIAWLMTGLLVLIFTPVLRVIASIWAFAQVRDKLYTWICVLVLIILIVAIIYGHLGA